MIYSQGGQSKVIYSLRKSVKLTGLISLGPAVLCDGVCQWWRPYVPDTAGWQVQGAGGRVSCLILNPRAEHQ